jgi:predicted GNAT superfamily acetyltransferase
VLDRDDKEVLVEIPSDWTSLIAGDLDLAKDWRLKTRRIFQTYFSRGYAVNGVHRSQGRAFYRLEKQ